jgi:phage repressor protein C with HTH and peptisase S24 domain
VPLFDIQAVAGIVPLINDSESQTPIDHIHIPNLPKSDGAIHVSGDSMYPILKSGDIVIYKHIDDVENNIFWGEMYLIAFQAGSEDFLMVKFIQKSELGDEYVKLVSQNQHHQDKDIKLRKISALAIIKASVRIHSMS